MLDLPEKHELIGFFECEPELAEPDFDSWTYNELTFTTLRGPDKVVAKIEAGWGSLSIKWEKAGQRLVWLTLVNLENLAVEMQKDDEFLVATGTHADQAVMLKLRLKPAVAIEFKQENL